MNGVLPESAPESSELRALFRVSALRRACYRAGDMRTADFDFNLPQELIAQQPASRRDASQLLVLRRPAGEIAHRRFPDLLEYLHPGDVLVLNNTRVIPARLRGVNAHTGGQFELLLLQEKMLNDWWVMLRPGKRARVGTRISLCDHAGGITGITATVVETNAEGHRRLQFSGTRNISDELDAHGEVPLPPYIARENPSDLAADKQRYQTVFAEHSGSVAAPTAGLHFTPALLDAIRARGVNVQFVTLHVGLGTFAPVKSETLSGHTMHEERYNFSAETAHAINTAKAAGRRVFAVGTTSVRVLESVAAHHDGALTATRGQTRIFIFPPFRFRVVDALLTNFHLPCSTLLMLVSAFAAPGETRGRDMMLRAYAGAIRERYRFFSYGDAMLII